MAVRFLILIASAILCVSGPLCAPAAERPRGGGHVRHYTSPETAAANYVAIMGKVARPAVYEVPQEQLTLAALVDIAGGLAPEASGNLRIVRQGRGGQQVFFSPDVKFDLLAGDLVVADSKGFAAGRVREYNPTVAAGTRTPSRKEPANSYVQIGLAQLVNRPVILDVPAEQATLPEVWGMLGQSLQKKGTITLLKQGSGRHVVNIEEMPRIALTSGQVLVVEPKTIDASTLPKLPQPRRPQDAAPATAAPTAEMPAVPSAAAASSESEQPAKLISGAAEKTPALIAALKTADQISELISQPERDEQRGPDGTGDVSHESTASAAVELLASAPKTGILTTSVAESEKEDAKLSPAESVGVSEPTSQWVTFGMYAAVLGIVVGIGGLLMTFVLIRAARKHPEPMKSMESPPAVPYGPPAPAVIVEEPEDWLERLIRNELPLEEEPLRLADSGEIFGRPVAARRLRIDAAHSIGAPHFSERHVRTESGVAAKGGGASGRARSAMETLAADVVEPQAKPAAAPRAVRVDAAHVTEPPSAVDRALVSLQGESA